MSFLTRPFPRSGYRLVFSLILAGGVASLAAQQPPLGPADGKGLAPTDTGRVSVGSVAPDFTLEALAGPAVTLSRFRGQKTVVLVFYRGHW